MLLTLKGKISPFPKKFARLDLNDDSITLRKQVFLGLMVKYGNNQSLISVNVNCLCGVRQKKLLYFHQGRALLLP